MRFAAAQNPAKIGIHSLNGENLMRSTPFRASSGSSPFLTLVHHRFLHAVFCKAARLRTYTVFWMLRTNRSPRRGEIFVTPDNAVRPQSGERWPRAPTRGTGDRYGRVGRVLPWKGERNKVMSFIDPRRLLPTSSNLSRQCNWLFDSSVDLNPPLSLSKFLCY